MAFVIKIIAPGHEGVMGVISRLDGPVEYLTKFDPDAHDGIGEIVTASDKSEAIRYPDFGAAMEAWKTQSAVKPFRPDGEPNRPMTAFSIGIEEAETAH